MTAAQPMKAAARLLVLLVAVAGVAQGREAHVKHPCVWRKHLQDNNITWWEFRVNVPQHFTSSRSTGLSLVEGMLKKMEHPTHHKLHTGFSFERHTRRTAIFQDVVVGVSTPDGQPLDSSSAKEYPWRQLGSLRLRRCMSNQPLEGAGARAAQGNHSGPSPSLKSGEAELLLKLRDVDPPSFPPVHSGFPLSVGWAHLRYGMRNEAYCSRQLAAYEASYLPLLGFAPDELSSLSDVVLYFPSLPALLGLPAQAPLPLHRSGFLSLSEWGGALHGVNATVSLAITYEDGVDAFADVVPYFPSLPDLLGLPLGQPLPLNHSDFYSETLWGSTLHGVNASVKLAIRYPYGAAAFAGVRGLSGELSFHLSRSSIEDTLGPEMLEGPLHAMAHVCEHLHDRGWSLGEPPLPPGMGAGGVGGGSGGGGERGGGVDKAAVRKDGEKKAAQGPKGAGREGGTWWDRVLKAVAAVDRSTAPSGTRSLWSLMPV